MQCSSPDNTTNTSGFRQSSHPRATTFTPVDIAYIAVFAALIIILGAIAIPVGSLGVPVVLQNIGPVLAGLILGVTRGGLATTLFIAVGLVGIPNLAGWKTTLAALSGPTVGYIVGYLVCAFVVGYLAERAPRTPKVKFGFFVAIGMLGMAIEYLCGSIGLSARTGISFWDAIISNGPFVIPDIFKVLAASGIAVSVIRAVPELVPSHAKNYQRS